MPEVLPVFVGDEGEDRAAHTHPGFALRTGVLPGILEQFDLFALLHVEGFVRFVQFERARDRSGKLDEWRPVEPPGGWTPAAVALAAREYAATIGNLNNARATAAAYRELMSAVPAAVKRAKVR